jgi:hypothetical protein
MSASEAIGEPVDVVVENVGVIARTTVSFTSGVTILAGRNATNQTPLLQGLMAGIGSENVSVKGDVEKARGELTVGDETYSPTLTRTNGGVHAQGNAYLDDPQEANLFAFVLEFNEAQRRSRRTDCSP